MSGVASRGSALHPPTSCLESLNRHHLADQEDRRSKSLQIGHSQSNRPHSRPPGSSRPSTTSASSQSRRVDSLLLDSVTALPPACLQPLTTPRLIQLPSCRTTRVKLCWIGSMRLARSGRCLGGGCHRQEWIGQHTGRAWRRRAEDSGPTRYVKRTSCSFVCKLTPSIGSVGPGR